MYKNMKQFKRAWIKALRSGDYKKGTGNLCNVGSDYDSFCCLGVAADLLILAGHDYEWKQHLGRYVFVSNESKMSSATGMWDIGPDWLTKWLLPRESTLINKNDTQGWNFKRIADWIEKQGDK